MRRCGVRKEEARAGYLDGQADAASEAGKGYSGVNHTAHISLRAEPDEEAAQVQMYYDTSP